MSDDLPANPVAAPLIMGMRELIGEVRELKDAMTRREEPAPGVFHIWPSPLSTKVRIRVDSIIIASLASQNLKLMVGSMNVMTMRIPINTTTVGIPITIDRGQTVQLIDVTTGVQPTDAEMLDAIIVGYADYAESDAGQRSVLMDRIGS